MTACGSPPAGSALGSSQSGGPGVGGRRFSPEGQSPASWALLSMPCPGELCQVEASAGEWGRNTLPSEDERLNHSIYGRSMSFKQNQSMDAVGEGEEKPRQGHV